MDEIFEIKSRLSIEEVVSQYVSLKKVGSSFKGLCPFHKEKTPSFIVSPEKQLAYCFGCNKGGDIFKFVQEIENVEFKDALKILADKAGVQIKSEKFSSVNSKKNKEEKEQMFDISEEAAKFFENALFSSEEGKNALLYLDSRGISIDSIKSFRLGYAPKLQDSLLKHLVSKGFSIDEILKTGLILESSISGKSFYDRFRGRLIFPIFSHNSGICGFTGRALEDSISPKYMNSPDSIIYNKSEVIYGFTHAKDFIKKEDKVVIVEGNVDTISSHQAGIKFVVASSGTALSLKHLTFLKRYTPNIYLSFDTDSAGKEALKRATSLSQELEIDLKIITFEGAKDPDELIKKDPNLWEKAINSAQPYFDYFLDSISSSELPKKEAIKMLLEIIFPVKNSIEKDSYIKKLAARFMVEKPEFIYDELRKIKTFSRKNYEKEDSKKSFSFTVEDYFFGLLLEYPEGFSIIKEKLNNFFFNDFYKNAFDIFLKSFSNNIFNKDLFFSSVDSDFAKKIKMLMIYIESKFDDQPNENKQKELIKTIDRLSNLKYAHERTDLLNKMKKAKEEGKTQEYDDFFKKYSEFLKNV